MEVYRARADLVSRGSVPQRVILNARDYRAVQDYHARLGEAPEGRIDYIDRYRIFDLEICVEDTPQPRVE